MRKILLYIIIIALTICTYLSISYAYYSVSIGTNQNISTNVAIDSCITLTVSSQVNLTGDKAVPITDNRALTNTDYRTAFTVYNHCNTAQSVDIAFAPGSANTMPIEAIKYAIYEQGATVPTTGTALSTNKIRLYDRVISETSSSISETVEYGYLIGNNLSIPANSSKAYYVNAWIDNSEGGGGNLYTANKTARLHLLAARAGDLGSTLINYIANYAPRSGIDSESHSPWILTSDHTNEWRYAGKNPDNYIQFNGELWRIIGVMPNMTYCTGEYGASTECDTTETSSLVKIVRNSTIHDVLSWDCKQTGVGSSTATSGSNDWSDSQAMYMLNGYYYMKSAYDVDNNRLHTSYGNMQGQIRDQNNRTFYNTTYYYLNDDTSNILYKPSTATTSSYTPTELSFYNKITSSALTKIATVKWDLYGINSYSTSEEGSPEAFYNKERNINNTGTIYTNSSLPENRPAYWYGKVGLIYPSDYGYATNGNNEASGTYSRTDCLSYKMASWASGDYKTYCAGNNYLHYSDVTSITNINTMNTVSQWTMTPNTSSNLYTFAAYAGGAISSNSGASGTNAIRPVVYLKTDIIRTGGIGTWNNPYTIE